MTATPETAGAIGFLTIPELLRDLLVRRATGQLVAYKGATVKKVFFKNGLIQFATSNRTTDRLGEILLARGMITREQYEASARQVVATRGKQGAILVQSGALTPKELFRGLIAQVRGIVVSICGWDEGNWRFLEGLPTQEKIMSLRLDSAGLIFEGLLSIAADPRWSGVADLRQLELLPAADAPFAIEQVDSPDAARRLFSLVGQGLPPQEMAGLIGRDVRDTAVLLHGLVLLKFVEVRPRAAVQPVPAAAAPAVQEDGEIRSLREKVSSFAGRLASLSHYQLLGVSPESEVSTIKRSYIALAKEYHPDRFFRPEYVDVQEAVNLIFMRISEAYSTLQNPAKRAEYDRDVLRLATAGRDRQPADESRLAKAQFTKGLDLVKAGDTWSGIEALRWAVNLAPENPRYHTWLGVALMRTKKRLQEAEEHCRTAIALDCNNAQYYVHLGQVYRTGHLFAKARKHFEMALRLDPQHSGALKEIREMGSLPTEKGLPDRFLNK